MLSFKSDFLAIVRGLIFFLILPACGKEDLRSQASAINKRPAGWETICMDRLLLNAPAGIEMGATRAEFQSAYGFNGIDDIGGKGAEWRGIKIAETQASDSAGLKKIFDSTRAKYRIDSVNTYDWEGRKKHIEYLSARAKSGTPDELAWLKLRIVESRKNLAESRRLFNVSGDAKLAESNAIALRLGDGFIAGFLGSSDKRVRYFQGDLSQPQVGSPEAAAYEYGRFKAIYHSRVPTDIPTGPGFCTAFGVIDDVAGPPPKTWLEIPFRSTQYPNLIFMLTVGPAHNHSGTNIQKLPRMNADTSSLHVIGIKKNYGPKAIQILGAPGRVVGHAYGPNCSKTSCRPADQAYEFEAETFGVVGRLDQPSLRLHMIAATSDDYKLKREPSPGEPSYNTPSRPALSGHVPPPYEEGVKIFEQVLASIRLRPGAFVQTLVAPAR